LREARTALVLQDKALSDKRAAVAAQANALSVVQQAEAALEIERTALQAQLNQINLKLKPKACWRRSCAWESWRRMPVPMWRRQPLR
jgi:hypothetical protein